MEQVIYNWITFSAALGFVDSAMLVCYFASLFVRCSGESFGEAEQPTPRTTNHEQTEPERGRSQAEQQTEQTKPPEVKLRNNFVPNYYKYMFSIP